VFFGRGFFYTNMISHKKLRRLQTECLARGLGGEKRAKAQRRDAAELRRRHGLCLHADNEKVCVSEADAAPCAPVICEECGKPKLTVHVFIKQCNPTPQELETARSLARGLLK
jgi:hypothetical protein